ncbi:CBS domain-containing protein [Georgenia sp. EYE_87]|uniref:CBS domain-containing protein n=1 Tax=Georgenia sp. EYE_87 TaxID=2853448 RepID=UPI0020062823|nr:CBS domain-containing protein [Georgenia sp. EYE_87]MCK6210828.1 CBS domain-containing protein [Georgenia sp. EYE_87]
MIGVGGCMEQRAAWASNHDLLRVARLIPSAQEVVTVQAEQSVREALNVMQAHGFDQLPVCIGASVIGVFSYRSFAQGIQHIRRNDDPLAQPVEDYLEDLEFVRAGMDVGAIMDRLNADGAVLVGEEDRLDAVMTLSDAANYLWQVTKPFVLLQDIELAVRSLMEQACSDPDELRKHVQMIVNDNRGRPTGDSYSVLATLSMGELLSVLLNQANYGKLFRATFGTNRPLVSSLLEPVREVRNKVFHFRDEVSSEELDALINARRYLGRRLDAQRARTHRDQ